MSELLPVNILIADRSYRLKVEVGDEEMVRKTAGLINEKIAEFRTQFAGKDMQDYVSMVLLWFATEQKQSGVEQILIQTTSTQLGALENMLDKALSENR